MVITSRVHTTFFVPSSTISKSLIRLPPSVVPQYETKCEHSGKILTTVEKPPHRALIWSSEEHERFLQGLELFPNGPWKEIAAIIGTKTTRQTMTHAQKYRQKIERRLQERPLKSKKRSRARDTQRVPNKLGRMCAVATSPLDVAQLESLYASSEPFADVCHFDHADDHSYSYVSSPCNVSADIVDSSSFDVELEALLASLVPMLPLVEPALCVDAYTNEYPF